MHEQPRSGAVAVADDDEEIKSESGFVTSNHQQASSLTPEHRKLLANWQAAKERCEVNRQLGEWLIELRSRVADNERHFTLVDCSLTPDDLVREVERIRLALMLNARRGR